jgi:AbrB family looped-hinge helix DNA binding protein
MISRQILGKGQIVIPKTIRDMLNLDVGDEMVIEVENDKIILSKKTDPMETIREGRKRYAGKISMKEIKEEIYNQYDEE